MEGEAAQRELEYGAKRQIAGVAVGGNVTGSTIATGGAISTGMPKPK